VQSHPRTAQFKEDIIQAFYDRIKHKPDTTFWQCEGRRARSAEFPQLLTRQKDLIGLVLHTTNT
jgi:hypothetical protein